ncbi:MAG TPA: nicotinate-nucleotide adenylyltransferase [Acidimicrobiales bacterium]
MGDEAAGMTSADAEVGERIGVFGGTFDPPHVGHVVAAVNVRAALALDRVLMVPAGVPWQKAHLRISPAEDRLAMLSAAVDGVDGLEVTTIELERSGESYTADTLDVLARRHPGAQLYLIVGSDIAPTLDTWRRPEALRELATTVVYERPGSGGGRPPAGWPATVVAVPQLDVSSTEIRARVRDGRPIGGLVVPAVDRHIRSRGLYLDAVPAEVAATGAR